jgi:hypothetical protein
MPKRVPIVLRLVFVASVAVLLCAQGAGARQIKVECTRSETPAGKSAIVLSINGVEVAGLQRPGGAGNAAVEQRLARAAQRISLAYREGQLSFDVKEQASGLWLLSLNGAALLSASDVEARSWELTDAKALAARWNRQIESALGSEMEAMRAAREARQSGAAETLRLLGAAPLPPAKLQPPPADPSVTQTLTALTPVQASPVKPVQPPPAAPDWATALNVSSGQQVYEPPPQRQASLPPNMSAAAAVVTGNPSSQEAARRALEALLRSSLGLEASSNLSWQAADPQALAEAVAAASALKGKSARANGKAPLTPEELPEPNLRLTPGAQKKLALSYESGALKGSLELLLQNRGIQAPRESFTFFSNAPEGVTRQQLLYLATLPSGQSARLVFHHQNQGGARLKLCARAVNSGPANALLHVIPGSCPADVNTYWVGFKSAESFWTNLNSNSGYALSIPAGGQALIALQDLPPAATASGYYKLSSLSGPDLLVETLVLNPGTALPNSVWPDTAGASTAVYPEPYFTQSAAHEVGGDWTYLRLGHSAPDCIAGSGPPLYGSYGMTYSFNVEVSNPQARDTGRHANVYVVLRGSAGEVKGQVYINDEYIASPLVAGGAEQILKVLSLAPGESRHLKIRAIALNGGFYPASIILRETRDP